MELKRTSNENYLFSLHKKQKELHTASSIQNLLSFSNFSNDLIEGTGFTIYITAATDPDCDSNNFTNAGFWAFLHDQCLLIF